MIEKTYDTDGNGRWWVTEWEPQCVDKDFFDYKCQGVEGHEGEHWCYKDDGSYVSWETKGGGSITGPGHKSWVSPVDKAKERYICHHTTTEVTDPELIVKLAADEVDACITGPCSEDEIEELKRLGRI